MPQVATAGGYLGYAPRAEPILKGLSILRKCTSAFPYLASANHLFLGSGPKPTYGKGGRPSSFKNLLCFAVAFRISSSIATSSRCVAARSISSSPTAVLM